MAQRLCITLALWLLATSTGTATARSNLTSNSSTQGSQPVTTGLSGFPVMPPVTVTPVENSSYNLSPAQQLLDSLQQQADSRQLASSTQWHKLIHLSKSDDQQWQTDIQADDFYMAGGDAPNPRRELHATLRAFLQSDGALADTHAQCRFPARLHWLATHLPAMNAIPRQPCKQFNTWLVPLSGQPVNVVHVSGFFGNPASAFGHLLLRIGESDDNALRGLLNTGINFGARIPPAENPVMYIAKGLLGGYTASFTDKQHYLQDHVYASVEARDMWAFELALSPTQQQLLISHLWELRGVPFSYYFLLSNCAYRIAELLELVLDAPLLPQVQPYYLPADVFYKLDDLNRENQGTLLKQIRFIPSQKRDSLNSYLSLTTQQQADADRALAAQTLDALDRAPSPALLDFLIGYTDYRLATSNATDLGIVNANTGATANLLTLKDELLYQRLIQPVAPNGNNTKTQSVDDIATAQWPGELTPDNLAPPGLGLRARVLRLSTARDRSGEHWQEVELSPFSFDLLDSNRGSIVDSSFRVLEFTLDNRDADGDVSLRNIDVLAFEKYSSQAIDIEGENPLAWRGGLSLQKEFDCSKQCNHVVLSAGAGRSLTRGRMLWYGLLNGELQLHPDAAAIGVSLGAMWRHNSHWRGLWQSNWYNASDERQSDISHALTIRYRPFRDHAIEVGLVNDDSKHSRLGYSYRW